MRMCHFRLEWIKKSFMAKGDKHALDMFLLLEVCVQEYGGGQEKRQFCLNLIPAGVFSWRGATYVPADWKNKKQNCDKRTQIQEFLWAWIQLHFIFGDLKRLKVQLTCDTHTHTHEYIYKSNHWIYMSRFHFLKLYSKKKKKKSLLWPDVLSSTLLLGLWRGSNPAGRDPLWLVLRPHHCCQQLNAGVLQLIVDDHMIKELPVVWLNLPCCFLHLLEVFILMK